MRGKQPMQAMSTEHDGAHDGTSDRPDKAGGVDAPKSEGGGESSGGAYPNPHTGKAPKGGFLGHGGQTEIAYSGTGQGGHDDDPVGNVNAVAKD
jgi:hypothetical protein